MFQLVQQAGEARGEFSAPPEAPRVVGGGEFGHGRSQSVGWQRRGEFGGREPGRFLIATALQDVEHAPVEQRRIATAGLSAARAPHSAPETQ